MRGKKSLTLEVASVLSILILVLGVAQQAWLPLPVLADEGEDDELEVEGDDVEGEGDDEVKDEGSERRRAGGDGAGVAENLGGAGEDEERGVRSSGGGEEERQQRLRERAEDAIENALDEISDAQQEIIEAERIGGDVSTASQLLSEARALIDSANILLEESPEEALSLARQARMLAKQARREAEMAYQLADQERERQEEIREARESIADAEGELRRARNLLEEAGQLGIDVNVFSDALNQAEDLISTASSLVEDDPEEAERIASIAEDTAERIIDLLEETIDAALEGAQEVPPQTRPVILEGSSISRAPNMSETEVEVEVEHEILADRGVVVQKLKRKVVRSLENGSVAVETTAARIIVVGNKTVLDIQKETRSDGSLEVERHILKDEEKPLIASIVIVNRTQSLIKRLDDVVRIEITKQEPNLLIMKIAAPEGTDRKIIITHVDPTVFELNGNKSIVVLVNGREIPIANELMEFLSGAYEEPAYILVNSARGLQLILHFPRFSKYTVEIRAIIERAVEGAAKTTRPILSNDSLLLATLAATIVLATASIMARRKRRSIEGLWPDTSYVRRY